ncbi:response regulator [Maridesulfovibrio ferrireducens]|uniref:Response regulator receiver domain-containing protein n=1 Tax=Maridesulfovibrio ferrireducens TaxID=246191 RepID=A0A1G9L7Z7_9BACT|nr:response regulator [Maridesulfovibrio ferrireducens]MBI9109933.1 response regulator [Maridesulfovibrio ferrireducens]SDL58004.1 Response regulator receiver domain-containing protein [Maridesulfovibrio ferrireducens]
MKKIRLLLVDDENDFLNAYVRRLVRRNVEVSVACRGRDAVEAVKATDFDVVVLDVMMPGMNGIETLRQIKAVSPALPVIILTGHAKSEALVEGMECGAFDFLLKPVGTEDLYYKMLDAIRSRTLDLV